ncbi:MAG: hypothetical protein DDT25_01297 [Chloroflexi bacterium]|nr:hypothetical protein [Chloroflexota bacterium]
MVVGPHPPHKVGVGDVNSGVQHGDAYSRAVDPLRPDLRGPNSRQPPGGRRRPLGDFPLSGRFLRKWKYGNLKVGEYILNLAELEEQQGKDLRVNACQNEVIEPESVEHLGVVSLQPLDDGRLGCAGVTPKISHHHIGG